MGLLRSAQPGAGSRMYSSRNSTSGILMDLLDFPATKGRGGSQMPHYGGVSRIPANVVPPPRTGPYAGRSVAVNRPEDLPRSVGQLGQMNKINKVREVKNLQRFHEQPGKARWRIRMARKRREFRAGIRVLFHLAKQAEKRGL